MSDHWKVNPDTRGPGLVRIPRFHTAHRALAITEGTQPESHSTASHYTPGSCPRCEWAARYYAFKHHTRMRQEYGI